MSQALKVVGTIAGVAALIPGPHQPIAAIVAVAANVGAQLTAKKPPAQTGQSNRTTIGANQPRPYLIGETYYAGNRRHWTGYGGKVGGVENPYLLMVDVYSGAGPVEGFVAPYLDFVQVGLSGNAATGYAANHLYLYHQAGQTPEPQALPVHWTTAPGWGPDYGLSSYAAISWCLRFDEDGKRFSAGIPATGAVWRGVKAYDPRKDSTYPGGNGAHRWANPSDKAAFAAAKATWEWTRCPGLHGLRYALGTWERDETNPAAAYLKTFGVGIPIDGIRVADFVALANVCDANGWTVDGVISEPGDRDANLKRILQAGGAERCWVGGLLGLKLSAPRVALDTITEADLANDEVEAGTMQGWEQRVNTLTPKYRSPDHKWEMVPSTPVTIAAYVEEDGEEKGDEREYVLVDNADQAAQLAAYELLDARELGEIVLTCKPRLRRYGPGDLLIVDLPDDGLTEQPCVVLRRTFDPVSMTVELILRGETPSKHAFALGRTGTAPPTPALGGTEAYDAAVPSSAPPRAAYLIIRQSVAYPVDGDDTTITIEAFNATIDDGRTLSFPAQTISGVDPASTYMVLWDFEAEAFVAVSSPALAEVASTRYVIVREWTTANADGTFPPTTTPPGGDGGGGYGGGGCPIVTARILLANADRTGPGDTIEAGRIEAGMWVWAQREGEAGTPAWGAYQVTMARTFASPLCAVAGRPLTSPSHLWWDRGWVRSATIGTPAGDGKVVALTVSTAATYVLVGDDGRWWLSHNKRADAAEA
ncbi:phage tail protein [Sphingomonas sp. Leaf10]|uniref:phage tail protein n=1 Tax=Sphingomonas sp. Leaf10 TaxID=1735676 RepID=UPI000B0F3C5B|nr:phage tail protein [Sphingomonas sp. Leaf10]